MVNISVETNASLDSVFAQTQPPHAERLSWKFFDRISLLDGQRREEDNERPTNHHAEDFETNEGVVLLSNTSLQRPTEGGFQPLTIMSASAPTVNGNHQRHQINTTSNNATGILRNATMIGPGSASRTEHSRPGHHTTTGGDPTGTEGCAGIPGDIGFHLALFGWRKKCLYILILGLMVLIIVNLILTLWILKVMEFSSEGMGQLKIVAGGIQLSGQALIMDLLRASAIRSRHGQPISIDSSRNFSIKTRDSSGILENHLFLGHDKLECLATGFKINDTNGRNLFSVNEKEVTIGAHSLKIDGEGGAIFRESVQTMHVRADAGRELRLESPTRKLEMSAAKEVNLEAKAGSLELSALNNIKFSAQDGSIQLLSANILIPNLKTVTPISPSASAARDHTHKIYQLCACSNGKLFLASPHSICAGDETTVCR